MNARPISPVGRLLRAALCFTLAVGLAFPPSTWALGPFEKNHPQVEKGIDAYSQGRYEDALAAFEAAKKELPQSAAVEFDRGNALAKLGRLDEAREAFHKVSELDRGELRSKDLYNLGNVWAQLGNEKEAIAAYRKALTLDPTDVQARHNLEVLLRKVPPPKQQKGPDGGTPDAGQDAGPDAGKPDSGQPDGGKPDGGPDGGRDGGQDGGSDAGSDAGMDGGADAGRGGDGGQGDGGQGDAGSDAGQQQPSKQQGDGGQPDEQDQTKPDGGSNGEGKDAGVDEAEEVDLDGGTPAWLNKKDAERLLDSMKQNEKNLQLWRFQQKKRPRKPNEKDW